MKKLFIISLLIFFFSIFDTYGQKEPLAIWEVPIEFQNQVNPYKNNKENISFGEHNYTKHCKACHNPQKMSAMAISLNMSKEMVDFSNPLFQTQSDGSLFYKIKTGKKNMPSFYKKLIDEDIWLVVHYIRTLKK